ncbi:endonuclease [Aquimarina addita]|uniref:Endonuclease n=1 Tax=Aquimarina addita TaxID=870485 RepID=A0ABP7XB34_9FLAO
MKISCFFLTFIFFLGSIGLYAQHKKTYKINTIAFYNLENLFDTEDDPITYDNDRTPDGKDHWTVPLYKDKLKHMAAVISKIGSDITKNAPALLGVAEIENRKVLEDLINEPILLPKDYGIIHYDSPDRRGIDVGLLYQKTLFKPTQSKVHELLLYDLKDTNKRIYTRDQLVVSGYLDGDLIHLIVNHWPSRSGGEARSRYKREKAAALNATIIDSIFDINPYAKIITMGDLNDNPDNNSVKKILAAKSEKQQVHLKGLYNPMYTLAKKGLGSLAWNDSWHLFDQIIVSKSLLGKDYTSYRFYKAGIYNQSYLTNVRGKYKGYPYRSYAGGIYTGGYSDHFPVYVYLIKEVESR